jgi:hypothetical protein
VKTSTMFNEVAHLIKELIENIGKIRQNRVTNSSSVKEQKRIIENEIQKLKTEINTHRMLAWFDLDYRCWLMTTNTCRWFLRLSLFALRLYMFVGLMHTFLCWLYVSGIRSRW